MNIGGISGGAPSAAQMQQMRQKMFAKVDGNGDGGIDKSEMKAFGSKVGLDDSKIDEAFSKFDTDGSGAIDSSEHEAVFEKIGEKLRGAFGSGGPGGASASSTSKDQDDVLMQMMDKIRENSQGNGTDALKQFLTKLQQQSGSYGQDGSKQQSSTPALFSQFA